MHIKQMISQHRRDFTAVYVCEHCAHEVKAPGYDDDNFHVNVIPKMPCPECKQVVGPDYQPCETKYPAGFVV